MFCMFSWPFLYIISLKVSLGYKETIYVENIDYSERRRVVQLIKSEIVYQMVPHSIMQNLHFIPFVWPFFITYHHTVWPPLQRQPPNRFFSFWCHIIFSYCSFHCICQLQKYENASYCGIMLKCTPVKCPPFWTQKTQYFNIQKFTKNNLPQKILFTVFLYFSKYVYNISWKFHEEIGMQSKDIWV